MPPLPITWAGLTDAGRFRTNNEDAFAVLPLAAFGSTAEHEGGRAGPSARRETLAEALTVPLPSPASGTCTTRPPHGLLVAVADGVGGQSAGEIAAALATTVLPEELVRFAEAPAPLPSRECAGRLETAVRRTNGRIRQEAAGDPARKDMAATLSALWIVDHRAFLAQVGDSRVYRLRGDTLLQLSHDQSEVGRAVRSGRISEDEAKLTTGRNLLDQALGSRDETLAPEIDWFELLPGDLFLLCSDGLVDRLLDHDLATHLVDGLAAGHDLPTLADSLLRRGLDSGSRDNITVLLLRTGDPRSTSTVAGPRPARARAVVPALLAGLLLGTAAGWLVTRLLASS
ncbi:hypothetical protein ASA1KI_11060 [Opitutales bacterium ASA1]|uniref:PP2C family protein-serine/threonine phosphatase n=1 Tax=Congregicoccus parvus TaxID=3081749 RepID=UPI002B2ED6DA|nr:hypothetical protein ASA1KI_11060 [Opitutales bacterium ASA1]